VTPHKSWRSMLGDPAGRGGPDYRRFPETAYFMDPDAIGHAGSSPLLQVPVTILPVHVSAWARTLRASLGRVPYVRRRVLRWLPEYSWLRPTGANGSELLEVLSAAKTQRRDYAEFMIHSSELQAGGSPTFPTQQHIDKLYEDLEMLFERSTQDWTGRTLKEYHDAFRSREQTDRPD